MDKTLTKQEQKDLEEAIHKAVLEFLDSRSKKIGGDSDISHRNGSGPSDNCLDPSFVHTGWSGVDLLASRSK